MILIAHRGNLNGPDPEWENRPECIQNAIDAGFEAELDIWLFDNHWYSGHDEPKHRIAIKQLCDWEDKVWFHAKNLEALHAMSKKDSNSMGGVILRNRYFNFNVFWHESDKFTLTSKGYIWTYPGHDVTPNSIIVQFGQPNKFIEGSVGGVCSDYIAEFATKGEEK